MSFDCLRNLAGVSPDLDLSVVSASVSPALLIETDRRKQGWLGVSAEHARLFETFCHICGVPKVHLFGRDGRKSEIVKTLGPCDVYDALRRAIHLQKLFLSADIVDCDPMVVVQINAGHISGARRKGDCSDSTRSSGQLKLANLFLSGWIPNMHRRLVAGLPSDDILAIGRNVQT